MKGKGSKLLIYFSLEKLWSSANRKSWRKRRYKTQTLGVT